MTARPPQIAQDKPRRVRTAEASPEAVEARHSERRRFDSRPERLTIAADLLRAERRAGEMLAVQVRAGNPQLSRDETIALADAGITRAQSHRWQTGDGA